jgi:predicted secreted protein
MTSGYAARTSQLTWNSQDILELTSISGPAESQDTIDMTSHDSSDGFKEFAAGLRDGGEISFEGNFIPSDSTGQIAMHTDFQAGTVRAWTIVSPSTVFTLSGNGYVTGWELTFPDDNKIGLKGKIKVTGKPTLTVA